MKFLGPASMICAAALMAGTALAQEIDVEAAAAYASSLNAQLETSRSDYRLSYMEYFMAEPGTGDHSRIVFFENRGNKQLATQFVQDDTRRAWSGANPNTIDWSYDALDISADVPAATQFTAFDNAMKTWDAQKCSNPGITGQFLPFDTGIVEGASGAITGDIMFSGFLPPSFFLALGSANILGVHFGFLFINPDGTPSDIDNNGFLDKAFGDVYLNDGFVWSTDGSGAGFDIETVALHEFGHGFSQQHFGSAFRTPSNGKLHFNPRAVMNATYSGVQRELAGTDNGGHCSLWGDWKID